MKKHLLNNLIGFILIVLSILTPDKAQAQTSCTISQTTSNFLIERNTSQNQTYVGQWFTACGTGKLKSVTISMFRGNSVSLLVYKGVNNYSSANFLGQKAFTASNNNITVDFSDLNISITEGEAYTFRLTGSDWSVRYRGTNVYAGGDMIVDARIFTGSDLYFAVVIDNMAPPLTSLSPANNADAVARFAQDFIMTFGANVKAGQGVIQLLDDQEEVVSSASISNATFSGNQAKFSFPDVLAANTSYQINVPDGFVLGMDDIAFKGIEPANWNITTGSQPAVELSTAAATLNNLSEIELSVVFSEAVTGLNEDDFQLVNATISSLTGSGAEYILVISPVADGDVTVSVKEDAAEDDQGNLNTASNTISFVSDRTFNESTVTSNISGTTTRRSSFTFTFTFDEEISGLEESDFELQNATLVSYTTSGLSATIRVEPIQSGDVVVTLPAGSVQDLAGNLSPGASLSRFYSFDAEFSQLAFYPLSGNTQDYRNVAGTLERTLISGNTFPTSIPNRFGINPGAYVFENTAIVSTGTFTSSTQNDGFAGSIWVRPVSDMEPASTRRTFFTQWATEQANTFAFYYEGGKLKLELNNKANVYELTHNFDRNTWYHLAFSVIPGGKVIFYVNNERHDVGNAPATLTMSSQNLYVGAEITNFGGLRFSAASALSHLRLFSRSISASEVDVYFTEGDRIYDLLSTEICAGQTFNYNDLINVTNAGRYTFLIPGEGTVRDTLKNLTLAVNALPQVFGFASPQNICEGESTTIKGRGAVTYQIFEGETLLESAVVSPSQTTTYTVTGTDAKGCANSHDITVVVRPYETPTANVVIEQFEFCEPVAEGVDILIETTEDGKIYTLRNAANNSVVAGPFTGNGEALTINTGAINVATNYVITVSENKANTSTGLQFDGVNDRVEIPFSESYRLTNAFTMEAWIYPTATTGRRILTNYVGNAANPGDIVFDNFSQQNNGRGLRLYLGRANGVGVNHMVDNVVTLNQWNHVAATFDNGQVRLFVNGNQVLNTTFPETTIAVNTRNWGLGEDVVIAGINEHFQGVMDDIRIWNYARSIEDIQINRNRQLATPEAGLVLYYKFDDGAGSSTVADHSGNENNGTMINMNVNLDWVEGRLDELACGRSLNDETYVFTGTDNRAPEVVLRDITVSLDNTGKYQISADEVIESISDNCTDGEFVYTFSKSTFNCDDIGEQEITFTAKDAANNTFTGTFNITIENYIEEVEISQPAGEACPGGAVEILVTNVKPNVNYVLRNLADSTVVAGPILASSDQLIFNIPAASEGVEYFVSASVPGGVNEIHAARIPTNGRFDLTGDHRGVVGEFTYSMWVKVTGNDSRLFSRTTFQYGYQALISGGRVFWIIDNGLSGGFNRSLQSSVNLVDGKWHLVTVTLNLASETKSAKIYIDGELDINSNITTFYSEMRVNTNTLVGAPGNGFAINHDIDQLAIWPRELSADEIRQHFTQNCYVPGGFTGLFNFKDAQGVNILDESPTGINGTGVGLNAESLWLSGVSPSCPLEGCEVNLSATHQLLVADDETAPELIVKNITLSLDEEGKAVTSLDELIESVTDNCTPSESIIVGTENQLTFDCTHLGDVEIGVNARDAVGNQFGAIAVVTIVDELAPKAIGKSITVSLSQEGLYTLNPALLDGGSTDNCGELTFSASKVAFTTEDLGANQIKFIVADASGNKDTADVVVTVIEFNAAPEVVDPLTEFEINEDSGPVVMIADLKVYFTDAENDELTFTVSSSNANLTAQVQGTSVVITPAANYFGEAVVTISATDIANTVSFDVLVTINAVNDAPVLVNPFGNLTINTGEFFTLTLPVPGQFADIDGDELTYSATTALLSANNTDWLEISVNQDETEITISGTPGDADRGTFQLMLTASDGDLSAQDVIVINVFQEVEGLFLYYPFTGNANNVVGDYNNGLVNGAVLARGHEQFDNTAYYFDYNQETNIQFGNFDLTTESFSISIWMKPEPVNENNRDFRLVAKRETCNAVNPFFELFFHQDTPTSNQYVGLEVARGGNATPLYTNTGNISNVYDWNHIVAVKDNEARNFRIYLNGELKGTTNWNFTGDLNLNNPAAFGASVSPCLANTANSARPFKGTMDEIRLYKRVITQEEIDELATRFEVNVAPDLVTRNTGSAVLAGFRPLSLDINTSNFSDDNGDDLTLEINLIGSNGANTDWITIENTNTGKRLVGTPTTADVGVVNALVRAFDGVLYSETDTVQIRVSAPVSNNADFLYYPLEGNTQNALNTNFTGTITGSVTYTSGFDNATKGAASFTTVNDKISFGNIGIGAESFTIGFWIKLPEVQPSSIDYRVLSYRATCNFSPFFEVSYRNPVDVNGYRLFFELYGGTSDNSGHVNLVIPNPTQWNHVAFVKDSQGRITKSYLNGVLIETANWSRPSGDLSVFNNGVFGVSTSPCTNNNAFVPGFNGTIDEIRLVKSAASTRDITIMASLPYVNAAPVVANPQPDVTTPEKQSFSLTLPANQFTDSDGDELTLTMQTTASWLSFNATDRRLTGTPLKADIGDHTVTITANDGVVTTSDSFVITVEDVNDAPSDILLSNNSIAENLSVPQEIGTLTTIDDDDNDAHTYSIVNMAGASHNAAFSIEDDKLYFNVTADFETQNQYTVGVRTTDNGGLSFDKVFIINITDVNEAPTNVTLSPANINENNAVGVAVGTLVTTDPDTNDSHTYSFSNNFDAVLDNEFFIISGNQVLINFVADFEVQSSYRIGVRATDAGGLFVERVLEISINDVNESPTDITLSNNTVEEHAAVPQTVGTLSTVDPDNNETFTYSLVGIPGANDNNAFVISGDILRFNVVADFEVKNSYTVGIRSTDRGGFAVNKVFTILVIDGPDPLSVDKAVQIKAYPNPATDVVKVMSAAPVTRITLMSIDGKALKMVEGNEMNVSELATGTYMLRIESEGKTHFQRIIKQ